MSISFEKFKTRVRTQSIVTSLLFGLGSAAMALAVLMAVFKLTGGTLPVYLYAAVACVAVGVTAGLYFILMPNDVRLAKRLDSLYSLDQKISTMVEYRNDDGVFAQLQREDAERRLSEKPAKEFKAKHLVAGLLVFFIAAGALLGAFLIPASANGEEPIDEFDRQWLITAIGELIEIVENSYAADSLKQSVAGELNALLDFVNNSQLLSEMKAAATKTVIAINEDLKEANSAEAIAAQFVESKDENIAELGKELAALSGSGSKNALIALGEVISNGSAEDAAFKSDEINAYLQSSRVRSGDELYILFKTLLSEVKGNHSKADESFEAAAKTLSSAIIVQNVNRSTMTIVINKLCNLFGITEDDITALDPDTDIIIGSPSGSDGETGDGSDGDDNTTGIGSGGLGTGDIIYGSNDIIYDPFTNTYRPYGDIINEYFAQANEQITDGKTTQDIADAAQEYFGALFGGNK